MKIINISNDINEINDEFINESKTRQESNDSYNISDFIYSLNMQNFIFVKEDNIVPFAIVDDKTYIISDSTDIKEEITNALETIKYDLKNLKELSIDKIHFDNELDKYEYYFIINSKYYIDPKSKNKKRSK